MGEPSSGPLTPVASLVRWPANDHGTPETVVPVRFLASAPVTVSSVSLGGDDPSDFAIRSDGCTGQVLGATGTCDVWVRSTPSVPGLRTATLVLRDRAGHAYTVPLQGWTYGGKTRLEMNSDPGDWVGSGQQSSYDPSNAIFEVAGTREGVSFSVSTDSWSGDFVPSRGDILTTGSTWPGAQRYPFQGSSPGMDVSGEGHGCNTLTGQFTVVEATYNTDGSVRTFEVQFEQHCEGGQPALRGEFDWRVGDHTAPAPWMSSSGFSGSFGDGSTGSGGGSTTGSGSISHATTTRPASTTLTTPSNSTTPGTNPGSGSTAQSLARTLLRLRADGVHVNRTLLQFRLHPFNRSWRRAAATAIGGLRRDVVTLARVLRRARPAGGPALTNWRRVQTASSSWQRTLLAEQRVLTGARAQPARVWSLDLRARAYGVTALKALAKLAREP